MGYRTNGLGLGLGLGVRYSPLVQYSALLTVTRTVVLYVASDCPAVVPVM